MLDEHYIISDVIGTLNDESILYIEIYVTSDKNADHRTIVRTHKLNTVEVDLLSLKNEKYITKNKIRDAVLKVAPREWLHIDWYDEELERIKKELELLPDKQSPVVEVNRPDALTVQDKNKYRYAVPTYEGAVVNQEEFNHIIEYMQVYRDIKTRRAIAKRYAEIFWKKYDPSCHIPDYCDVPISGELAFNKYRAIWQEEIIDYLEQSNVVLSVIQITDYVVTQVSLNKLV